MTERSLDSRAVARGYERAALFEGSNPEKPSAN
jgi:hypothetical protein